MSSKTIYMNSNCRKILVLFFMMGYYHYSSQAQLNVPKYEIGATFGGYVYQGDLTPSPIGSIETMQPGFNLHASRLLSRSLSIRGNFSLGRLRGDDAVYEHPEYRQRRSFKFTTPVTEISAWMVWNLLGKNYADRGFSPYLFGGVGVNFLDVRKDYSKLDMSYFGEGSYILAGLAADEAHGTPSVIPVVPVGLGLRYNISSRWAVNAETSYRFVFTDYLDGFSQAAGPGVKDHYHTTSVGFIYRIGKKNMLDCPPATF
jgi:opacity protein-like surface antigen